MIRLLADENFNGRILRGLLRRCPDCDIVRVQDVGLSGEEDPAILAWASHDVRILLTHDAKTVPAFAKERVKAGEKIKGGN